ncbi:MAG: formimidoylglutamase [Candidatus Marinimicrobia bacterium]|nr:formimidoylglutamase [Candidatus Neomarinimicrobiota bacterium]
MRLSLKNYSVSKKIIWSGRVDDPGDPDSYRVHQIMNLINLTNIDDLHVEPSKSNICLIGFQCDEGVKKNLGRPGAARGPESIRKEFANFPAPFSEDINIFDAGNILCTENNLNEAQDQLAKAVKLILDHNMFPLVLGGGHETALGNYNGIVKHLSSQEKNKSAPAILNFDAHLDFRPFKDGGSSGSMFYQIAEKCAQNKTPFAYMCLGVQTYSNTLSMFKRAESFGSKYILAKNMTEKNFPGIIKDIDYFIEKQNHVYVTICSDVFNSAYAPGVSAPQPFGLDPETVLIFIKHIFKTNKVISLDIAEVSPRFDHDNNTAKLAAVIIYAIINVLSELKKSPKG